MKSAAMKRRIIRFNTYVPYPNAMTGRENLNRILNGLMMVAVGMGIAAALLMILTLAA